MANRNRFPGYYCLLRFGELRYWKMYYDIHKYETNETKRKGVGKGRGEVFWEVGGANEEVKDNNKSEINIIVIINEIKK